MTPVAVRSLLPATSPSATPAISAFAGLQPPERSQPSPETGRQAQVQTARPRLAAWSTTRPGSPSMLPERSTSPTAATTECASSTVDSTPSLGTPALASRLLAGMVFRLELGGSTNPGDSPSVGRG